MSTITTNHCLPENIAVEASFYERLKAFVFQYESILEERAQATGKYLEAENKRKTSIRELYVYSPGHCESLSRNEIAKKIIPDLSDLNKIRSAVEIVRTHSDNFRERYTCCP